MAAPSSRMSWIDFAKGLLMILVFVYHSEVIYGNGHSWSWLFEMFFLTGFFYAIRLFVYRRFGQSLFPKKSITDRPWSCYSILYLHHCASFA